MLAVEDFLGARALRRRARRVACPPFFLLPFFPFPGTGGGANPSGGPLLRRLTSPFQQHSVCHPVLTSPTRTHRGANKLSEHTTTTLHPTRNPTACAPGFYLRLSFLVVFFFAPLCRVFHPLFFSFLPSPPPLTHPHYHHHSPPGPRPAFHPPAVSSCDLRLSPLPPFCRRPTYKKNT